MRHQISYDVTFIFHTHININCKKCIVLIFLIFSQLTPMCLPQNLTQLRHCEPSLDVYV